MLRRCLRWKETQSYGPSSKSNTRRLWSVTAQARCCTAAAAVMARTPASRASLKIGIISTISRLAFGPYALPSCGYAAGPSGSPGLTCPAFQVHALQLEGNPHQLDAATAHPEELDKCNNSVGKLVGDPGIEPGVGLPGGVTVRCRTLQLVARDRPADRAVRRGGYPRPGKASTGKSRAAAPPVAPRFLPRFLPRVLTRRAPPLGRLPRRAPPAAPPVVPLQGGVAPGAGRRPMPSHLAPAPGSRRAPAGGGHLLSPVTLPGGCRAGVAASSARLLRPAPLSGPWPRSSVRVALVQCRKGGPAVPSRRPAARRRGVRGILCFGPGARIKGRAAAGETP